MKVLVVTLLVISVTVIHAAPNAHHNSIEEHSLQECLQENEIKEEDIEELAKKKDPKLQCLAACVFEKEGFIKDGWNKDAIVKTLLEEVPELNEADVKKFIDSCTEKVKDIVDVCDGANALTLCIKDELDKLGVQFE